MPNRKNKISKLTIFLGIIALDQLVKLLILQKFPLIVATNKGGAFGIGDRFGGYAILSLLLIILAFFLMRKNKDTRQALAYLLIISGATSNLIDRIFRGAVVDYIDLKFFASFNLADLIIVSGATALILVQIFSKKTN